jgi:protein arginine kinase activator
MICEHCRKRNATTHITETINGVTKKLSLCSLCASEMNYNGFLENMNIGNLLGSVFLGDSAMMRDEKKCSVCGSTRRRIIETGLAGCSDCYRVFKTELLTPIEKIHGKVSHIGKRPNVEAKDNTEEIIREKEELLKKAVEEQDFETAASLRDEIKNLKGGEGR